MSANCDKCKKSNFLSIYSRACDGNYFQWNDREEKQGYLPNIPGLCDSNGSNFTICIECGWISGLNLKKIKTELSKEFASEEESSDSEDEPPKKNKKSSKSKSKKVVEEESSDSREEEPAKKTKSTSKKVIEEPAKKTKSSSKSKTKK